MAAYKTMASTTLGIIYSPTHRLDRVFSILVTMLGHPSLTTLPSQIHSQNSIAGDEV